MRALSIIMVLITHLGMYHILPEYNFIKNRVWLLISGATGVNIFFVLSGFLITKILLTEKINQSFIYFKKFYIRRFIRLLPPLFVFYLILLFLTGFGFLPPNKFGLLFSILYCYNFVSSTYYTSELGHTWSLALEEQFYILWPLVINYFKTKRVMLLGIVIVIICIILKCLLPILHIEFNSKEILLSSYFKVNRWFFPAVAPIIIGSLFALKEVNKSYIQTENKWYLTTLILLFLSPLYFPHKWIPLTYITQAISISMLLIWIINNQKSRFTIFLEKKPIAYIGKISYGLYVYQGIFLGTGPSGSLVVQQFPLNILLTFIIAILSYELYERKVMRLKKKFN